MEINRNQYFLVGMVLLFLGIQLRMVYSYQLTPEFTQFLAERTGHPLASVGAATQTLTQSETPLISKTFLPPEYLGWALLSVGAVLILHSCAMNKPD